jgi:hypothetical protein
MSEVCTIEAYTKALYKIAELAHEIWANWYKYQRDNGNAENIERWNRQARTEYNSLSDEDKEKDIKIAKQYFDCFFSNFNIMLDGLVDKDILKKNKEDK